MTTIIFADQLDLGGEHLAVHLASDRQIYVGVDDLCSFIGIDTDGMIQQLRDDVSTADIISVMSMPGDTAGTEQAAFLNLAALP